MLAEHQLLNITYRIEPGTLGSNGMDFIEGFCGFLMNQSQDFYPQVIRLNIVPRYDKSLPEKDFFVMKKHISYEQAEKYLQAINLDIEDIEDQLDDRTSLMVDDYFAQHS
ncbi:hypothetical protein [Salinibius halmophilus]|uniref:hypothetical protein n=1 Tax=Salinibius halmophilus TaxID=1853216 RepID=UPI000E671D36|nr:hypothetical protein [Salinibius halmophilus]